MCRKALMILFVILCAFPASADVLVHPAWVGVYNGTGNSHDDAKAIVVDGMGNVYVTGQSMGDGTDWDYATVKYYPDGEIAWTARYDGPASSTDIALAIAVDGSGNVFVTGHSQGIDNSDVLTVKYYSDGDTAWIRRYNGPVNSTDAGFDIAVDQYGNAYVTGYSRGSSSGKDYLTVKYLTDGTEAWVATYNGPENGNDEANAIAVDDAGNVHVTGNSSSFATVKYDADGNQVWARRYTGPVGGGEAYAIALDESSNVLVTGTCGHGEVLYQYATVKYDSDGNEIWARTHSDELIINPGGIARDIGIGGFNEVYVTGWLRHGGTLTDYGTVKYDSEGNWQWTATYHSWLDGCDGAKALAVDDLGNVYITGYSDDLELDADDYLTVKYDPDGNQLWTARYNGTGNDYDDANDVVTDGAGNVYVTGKATGSVSSYDFVTIKYVEYEGVRGDANGDGIVESGDVVYLLNYLFRGDAPPDPLPTGDCNCDGMVGPGDVVYLINYLFRGGPAPSC
jgi:hypothetical protein